MVSSFGRNECDVIILKRSATLGIVVDALVNFWVCANTLQQIGCDLRSQHPKHCSDWSR